MLIGISGKIGSGKDTVAKIIQYWTFCKTGYGGAAGTVKNCVECLNNGLLERDDITSISGWRIMKFAGKLKEIISLLTGVSLADLEKEEIKNSLLPDNWQIWEIYNWGNKLVTLYTEKQAIYFCNTNSTSQTNLTYKKSERTYRWLLQYIGTELFRDGIHQNVHINALFADYNLQKGKYDNLAIPDSYPKWLITDLRFPNELNAIEERNGITIRVNRLKYKYIDGISVPIQKVPMEERDKYLAGTSNSNEHPSETALDNAKFDYTIENNGTIEELVEKVKEILVKEKLI